MKKVGEKKIMIIRRTGQGVSGSFLSGKGGTWFGFSGPSRDAEGARNAMGGSGGSAIKHSQPHSPQAGLAAVKNWVALEEKIVHDYKEPRPTALRNAVSPPRPSARPLVPAFETFSTQTAASPFSRVKGTGSQRIFSRIVGSLVLFGWIFAGIFMHMHAQDVSSSRLAAQGIAHLQNEKERLERSEAALKGVSMDQAEEIGRLNDSIRGMASELQTVKADAIARERSLENQYREELMRITVGYEAGLDALRSAVQTQNAVVKALKTQNQVFDRIVDQVSVSALSGAAAGFSRGSLPVGETFPPQGKVASVNGRRGFIVVDWGGEQGVRTGVPVTISRSGIVLADGRVDRVYPTMSVAILRDPGMLPVIQAGDNVSFS